MTGHRFTPEQNDFIRNNYSSVARCVELFNERFGTELSYSSIKSHALHIGVKTKYRPWTKEMNNDLRRILEKYSYAEATTKVNALYGTNFTRIQIQNHCTRCGIKRGFAESRKKIDEIISGNIDKPYGEIAKIIQEETGIKYKNEATVCVRANNIGLNRPHRKWSAKDRRFINGKEVSSSEFSRFVGHRWHRLPKELQETALLVVKLQAITDGRLKGE